MHPVSLEGKTRAFTASVVLSNVLGNLALSWGMKQGPPLSTSPLPYLQALLNPWVLLGISLLITWMLSRMALLSWADLSYVLPVTSIGYVLAALAGWIFLEERISWQRWIGVILIVAGTALVSLTAVRTTAAPPEDR